ncbi:hypothetical protein B0H63DRAFT_385940 [Podospora didyma]|uniref:Ig-like domain-containing protein n=1 Tax=Podospora didyma TaxID=330526 RepID=A0AAE0P8B0_9PEZI|nr:hypothetical protein B0H63DRAFT_385940 [Podospora didyma]
MTSRLKFLALLAGALNGVALAQQTAAAAADCTATSFAIPSWLVYDFQSVSSTASSSFRVLNRATNTTAELTCQRATNNQGWSTCSAKNGGGEGLAASVQLLNSTTARVLLNETWSCSDVKPHKNRILFTAVGNYSIALTCSSSPPTCKSTSTGPALIQASLLSPVKITPAYLDGPPGHDNPGCTASSKTPAWELGNTQYNHRTIYDPQGEPVGVQTQIFLQTINNATGHISACVGPLTNASVPHPLICTVQEPIRQRKDVYQSTSSVYFTPHTLVVSVNETWFCDDLDPTAPVSITATSTATLPLSCQTFNRSEIESAPEIVTFCTGPDEPFSWGGTFLSQAPLPPYALRDPVPSLDSCTISSVLSLAAWRLSDFETVSSPGNDSFKFSIDFLTSVGANVSSVTEFPAMVNQTGSSVNVSSNEWVPCKPFGYDAEPDVPRNCSFRWDEGSKFLSVDAEWWCADLDKEHPVRFTSVANTLIPDVSCVTEGTTTRCTTPAGKPWVASVGPTSWTA